MIRLILPERSVTGVSGGLITLTEVIHRNGLGEIASGLLGGEYGYGAWFENDTFKMAPFCWCDSDDCDYCLHCTCDDADARFFVNDEPVDFETWSAALVTDAKVSHYYVNQCDLCTGKIAAAPNFWHKRSGFAVWWYKYIGRSMEYGTWPIDPNAAPSRVETAPLIPWGAVLHDCLGSLDSNRRQETLT